MMIHRRWVVLPLVALLGALGPILSLAQRGRGGRGPNAALFERLYDSEGPETEFAIARWYSDGWQSDGWYHDYPDSEEHILQIMKEVSLVNTNRSSYKVVDLASPEIFRYPFAYVSHPGELDPSDAEIDNLREYVERGGFIMMDDFGGQDQGPWEFQAFLDLVHRAFPDRDPYELTDRHHILEISYVIDSIQMVHPMSGAKSVFYGFNDSKGRLAMVICYANDIGDYWEFIDQPRYAVKPSAEALKLGVNIALYSMTH
jgi:hypothetical protein